MEFLEDFQLKNYNTFGISVSCKYFCEVISIEEIKLALNFAKSKFCPFLILGGGSNILFTESYKGLVIHIKSKGIKTISEDDSSILLEVQAGEIWHDFVMYTVENNYGGLENLSLIPGTVGASPMQNIGAYGVEIKDTCVEVAALDIETNSIKTFSHSDCQFGYRNSYFKYEGKGKYIITSVKFRLSKNPDLNTSYGQIKDQLLINGIIQPTIFDVSKAVIEIRQSKLPDPKVIGNAGSFFKNPTIPITQYNKLLAIYPNMPSYKIDDKMVKIPAGWLIEQKGWKGKITGNAAVHDKQALVLVNKSSASGKEVFQLASNIKQDILQTFGIELEIEVNVI